MAEEGIERFQALARAGFKVETFGDIVRAQYERLGGHYMDVGCSAKIAKGLVSRDGSFESDVFFGPQLIPRRRSR